MTVTGLSQTTRNLLLLILLLLLLFSHYSGAYTAAEETSFLMVGNSFIDANDLEFMVEQLLAEGSHRQVYAMRFDQGSSRFAEHVQEPSLHEMIRERAWDWVLLQEQSEIPAFGGTYYQPTLDLSLTSLITLDEWIRETSSQNTDTVLFMTWARIGADPYYPDLFPNFEHMQQKVKEGYLRMQQTISTAERPVPIVPAGLAFQYMHEHCCPDGIDPASNGTEFVALYDEDTIHPSVWGSYLAACTIYATLTPVGYPAVTHLQYGPPGWQNSNGMKQRLQEAAQTAVLQFNSENSINRQYMDMKREAKKTPYRPVSPPDRDENSSPSSSPPSPTSTNKRAWSSILVPTVVGLIIASNLWLFVQQKRQMTTYSGRHRVPSSQDDNNNGYDDTDDDLQLRHSVELPEIR